MHLILSAGFYSIFNVSTRTNLLKKTTYDFEKVRIELLNQLSYDKRFARSNLVKIV